MPSLLSRLSSAVRGFRSPREERFVDHTFMQNYEWGGRAHPFRPTESLTAYGDNPYLYSSVNVIAAEISRTPLRAGLIAKPSWRRFRLGKASSS